MTWSNKTKGNHYENESGKFWRKIFNIDDKEQIGRTPRSGAMWSFPGDLLILKDCVLKDFIVDVKSEQNLLTKKLEGYYDKNDRDAQGKPSFIEMYINYKKPMILISRDDFANVLRELDGFREEQKLKN